MITDFHLLHFLLLFSPSFIFLSFCCHFSVDTNWITLQLDTATSGTKVVFSTALRKARRKAPSGWHTHLYGMFVWVYVIHVKSGEHRLCCYFICCHCGNVIAHFFWIKFYLTQFHLELLIPQLDNSFIHSFIHALAFVPELVLSSRFICISIPTHAYYYLLYFCVFLGNANRFQLRAFLQVLSICVCMCLHIACTVTNCHCIVIDFMAVYLSSPAAVFYFRWYPLCCHGILTWLKL